MKNGQFIVDLDESRFASSATSDLIEELYAIGLKDGRGQPSCGFQRRPLKDLSTIKGRIYAEILLRFDELEQRLKIAESMTLRAATPPV
jgi:hypothetical protein